MSGEPRTSRLRLVLSHGGSARKTFRCGDLIPDCPATFTATDAEMERQIAEHARRDHGMTEVSEETMAAVRAHVRDVS